MNAHVSVRIRYGHQNRYCQENSLLLEVFLLVTLLMRGEVTRILHLEIPHQSIQMGTQALQRMNEGLSDRGIMWNNVPLICVLQSICRKVRPHKAGTGIVCQTYLLRGTAEEHHSNPVFALLLVYYSSLC